MSNKILGCHANSIFRMSIDQVVFMLRFFLHRATVSEDEIKEAFTNSGFSVKAFKFFPKDRKMALIQMPSMDDAVAALIVSFTHRRTSSLIFSY